jgi:hypothetical protein
MVIQNTNYESLSFRTRGTNTPHSNTSPAPPVSGLGWGPLMPYRCPARLSYLTVSKLWIVAETPRNLSEVDRNRFVPGCGHRTGHYWLGSVRSGGRFGLQSDVFVRILNLFRAVLAQLSLGLGGSFLRRPIRGPLPCRARSRFWPPAMATALAAKRLRLNRPDLPA